MKKLLVCSTLISAILATGCATDNPNQRAIIGGVTGAVLGGVVGHQVNDKNGRYVGAVLGGLAGAAVGGYMDKQQREVEAAMQKEIANGQVNVERQPDNSLKVAISDKISFDVNSASIKPDFFAPLNSLANSVKTNDKTVIHVIGHTDSSGADDYNQKLSKNRALSVANYLKAQTIAADRLFTYGRGEAQPVASNDTVEGKAKNRRVEIIIKPIVEGNEKAAYSI